MTNFYKNKKVAVTGGLGLIGSFLCEELLKGGAKVILVDDESKGTWKYIPHLKNKVEFRKKDLTLPKQAEDALKGADHVFHLASRAYGVGFSHKNNFEMFRFNDLVNTNVLDAIAKNKPKSALVVSSSCVYPDDGPTPMSDRKPYDGEPEMANWGYGWAKRILEHKAKIYMRETGIPITIVRPFNIYGEHYNWVGQNSQAIPMLVKKILDRENPIVVWGTGSQKRTYIHAEDAARIMMRFVEKGFSTQPINIGLEETISVKELVLRVAEHAKIPVNLVFDTTKPEGRLIKSADSKLMKEILGKDFKLLVDTDEGLKRMINWYKETFTMDGTKEKIKKLRVKSHKK